MPRTDATPARHNEGRFAFLNRSASQYFQAVRDLIEDWFAHLPQPAKNDLRGALRADDRQMESAFWELFLHEAYRCSGYEIEIHPDIPGRPTRPDFRMTRGEERFYLEAVGVGQAATAIGEDRRLQDLHQILTDLQVQDFSLELSTYTIGPKPLATKRLRREIQAWLANLNLVRRSQPRRNQERLHAELRRKAETVLAHIHGCRQAELERADDGEG